MTALSLLLLKTGFLSSLIALASAQQPPLFEYVYSFNATAQPVQHLDSLLGNKFSQVITAGQYFGPAINASFNSTAPALQIGTYATADEKTFDQTVTFFGSLSDGDTFSMLEEGLHFNSTSIVRQIWTVPSTSSSSKLSNAYILCKSRFPSGQPTQGDCWTLSNSASNVSNASGPTPPTLTSAYSINVTTGSDAIIQTSFGPQLAGTFPTGHFSGELFHGNATQTAIGTGPVNQAGSGFQFNTVAFGKDDQGSPFAIQESGLTVNGSVFSRQSWLMPSNSTYSSLLTSFVLCSAKLGATGAQGQCYVIT